VVCVSVETERSRTAEELVILADRLGIVATPSSLEEAKALIHSGDITGDFACVTGSVYLAGAWAASGPVQKGEA